VVAIFKVGWMNIDEAVAKIPVDLTLSPGFPIGFVNLAGWYTSTLVSIPQSVYFKLF